MDILLFLLLTLIGTARAEEGAPTLSHQTYQSLMTARELQESGKSSQAVKQLEALMGQTAKQPYEQAVVLQSLAHAYIDNGNYKAAIPYLKRSLELQALPQEVQQRASYDLAQLYMATDQYAAAVRELEVWFKSAEKPDAAAYVLLGSAHLQLEQYRQAIAPLRKAIELSDKPQEGWYQSLLGAYHMLKDYRHCADLLRGMINLFPERDEYWRQLSAMELQQGHPAQALAVLELAYLRGRLVAQRDLLDLAQLYAMQNAPYKAGDMLESEIARQRIKADAKIWEQLANIWQQAKETDKAIAALENSLSVEADPGRSLRLAQLYLEGGQHGKARARLRNLLQQKQGKTESQAWMLLGIACYEDAEPEQAKAAFSEAQKFTKTRQQAEQWLAFLARSE